MRLVNSICPKSSICSFGRQNRPVLPLRDAPITASYPLRAHAAKGKSKGVAAETAKPLCLNNKNDPYSLHRLFFLLLSRQNISRRRGRNRTGKGFRFTRAPAYDTMNMAYHKTTVFLDYPRACAREKGSKNVNFRRLRSACTGSGITGAQVCAPKNKRTAPRLAQRREGKE